MLVSQIFSPPPVADCFLETQLKWVPMLAWIASVCVTVALSYRARLPNSAAGYT